MSTKRTGITLVGIGGGGCNTVGWVYDHEVAADCLVVNTDAEALGRNECPNRVVVTSPDGAEVERVLAEPLAGARLVILTAGFGGTSGTTITPIAARIAKAQGAAVVAFIFTPFTFEGAARKARAAAGLEHLNGIADWVVTLPCAELAERTNPDWTIQRVFEYANDALRHWVNDLVVPPEGPIDAAPLRDTLPGSYLGRIAVY